MAGRMWPCGCWTDCALADQPGRVPNLFVIAGPNGAGKSTSAPELLSGVRRVAEFVNADVIQKEQGVSEIAAGRMTLNRLARFWRTCQRGG